MPDSTVPTWTQFAECTSAAEVAALEPPGTVAKTSKCFNLVALPAFLTKALMQLNSLDPKLSALLPSKPSASTPPIVLLLAWLPEMTILPLPPLRKKGPPWFLSSNSSGCLKLHGGIRAHVHVAPS
jgi:hypothetical protein